MIPTEPIGSIPRPAALIDAVSAAGDGADPKLDSPYEDAVRDTVAQIDPRFAKISARVQGTALAVRAIEGN